MIPFSEFKRRYKEEESKGFPPVMKITANPRWNIKEIEDALFKKAVADSYSYCGDYRSLQDFLPAQYDVVAPNDFVPEHIMPVWNQYENMAVEIARSAGYGPGHPLPTWHVPITSKIKFMGEDCPDLFSQRIAVIGQIGFNRLGIVNQQEVMGY